MRVVVVGADAAGMGAAHQALRAARRRGVDLQVVAVERTAHTSYSACGLPYWVSGDVAGGAAALVARTADEHRRAGVDLRLRTEATALDLDRRTVAVRGPSGDEEELAYDRLVLATGARARVPGWARTPAGGPVRGVRPVRTLDDGAAWIDLVLGGSTGDGPRSGVVVGGGYIGVEMAEAFVRRGLDTTLVTRTEVMATLEPELGARLHRAMESAGVRVVCGDGADGLDRHPDGAVAAVHAGGERIAADVVALGLGADPATGLAAAAGLPLGEAGGLLPDDRQRVADGVWAAGDCCEHVERLGGRRVHVPLGTHAAKQGRVAGEDLVGGDARFGGVLGTAITRFVAGGVHVEVARTGPTLAQARALPGVDPRSLLTESTTASGYMPEARPVAVLVSADARSRRLLGGQIVGGEGSAKRIDTLAAALWCGASIDDVAAMDLSYAPPFSPVWDPVQIACRRLAERL